MKTTTLLSFLLAASTMTAQARELTSDEALARVVAQWNANATGPHRAPLAASAFSLAKVGTNAALQNSYYIFDRTSGGFVVASADDEQPAVLALIDEGKYDEQNVPDGFKAWLAEVTTYGAAKAPAKAANESVAPLLDADQIAWGQEAPYNNDCPKIVYNDYPYTPLAGCAAIAIGQIMRYHKYPAAGTGTKQYDSYVYVQGVEIKTAVNRTLGVYDWNNILGNYTYTQSNGTQAAAVAKFVADVACACEMNFDPKASATTDLMVAKALKNNFYYDKSLQLVDHAYYTTEEWGDLLRRELDEGRPVYLSGANVTNTADGDALMGHAFVCDGYNSNGQFHINWGWNGASNGYFYLTKLNPANQGAGGSAGGYSFMSNAIIGIQPDQDGAESKAILSLSGEYWETSYDAENDGYVVRVNIANVSASDFEGFVALRLMEDDTELLSPKQLAWKLGCKAGASGTLGKGVNKDFFLSHPTARIELVYAHRAGVNTATAEELTQMLEGIGDDEWLPIASREGAPKSLQTFVDAVTQKISFGNKPEEVFQLRFAGLDADMTPVAGRRVTFTAKVTNESDYEYFAPLYLFIYDSGGNQIAYSDYDLHLLPAHSTKKYNFTMTLPSGYSSFRYAMAYEDKGYDWSYVPMPLSNQDGYMTANLFEDNVPVTPDPEQPGTDPDEPDPDEPGYTPADGAKAYYVKNVDSGYYLNVVESERTCAVLGETPEVLYFEPTNVADEYIIKGHTGLYLGGHEDNVWNMSSSCPETWIVETQADGSVAFHAKSNANAANGYIGFDTNYFQYYALGATAKRNQRTTAHGLFMLEAVGEQPEEPAVFVSQITLTAASTLLTVGETLTISATVAPDNAKDKSIEWTTSDASVAIVEDGVVTAVGAGYVVITATATDGSNVKATLQLEVKAVVTPDPEEPATDLTIAAVGAPVVMDGTTFPMADVPYYIKNVDSGCYLNIEESGNKCAVLRNDPEPLYFTASGTGFIIKDADGLYLGGHTNGWNMASNVKQVWTLKKIEEGVYALQCDKGYVGFDDSDGNRDGILFKDDADGFAAFRDKDYNKNHGKFIIERANIYGDIDENRTVNSADVSALVSILLRQKDVTPEADTDLNRVITIGDVTKLINYLKK